MSACQDVLQALELHVRTGSSGIIVNSTMQLAAVATITRPTTTNVFLQVGRAGRDEQSLHYRFAAEQARLYKQVSRYSAAGQNDPAM